MSDLLLAYVQVATNWDEEGREKTSPENDYSNNELTSTYDTQLYT